MRDSAAARQHSTTAFYKKAVPILHGVVMGCSVAMIGALLVWMLADGGSDALQFRFNPYALLSLVAFLSSTVTTFFVVRIRQRTDSLVWFALFLAAIAGWALAEALLRLSATPESAAFWAHLTTIGSVFMPVGIYMFALTYARPKLALQPYVATMLLMAAALFVYLDARTDIFTDYMHMTSTPWGYVPVANTGFLLISLWAVTVPAAALLQFELFRRTSSDATLRVQAKLFVIAIAIPLVGGTLTDGLLPLLHIEVIPPLSNTLLTVMSVIICYGILKYRFFSFTPSMVAGEILGTINEAVLGVGPDMRISYANAGAEQLLGVPAVKLSGRALTEYLADSPPPGKFRAELEQALGDQRLATVDAAKLLIESKPTVKLSISKLDARKEPYGYLVVMTDITALTDAARLVEHQVKVRTRELHEEQAKLRASIEGLPLGFALFDPDQQIIVQNTALQHICGHKHTALTLDHLESLFGNVDLRQSLTSVLQTGTSKDIPEAGMASKVLRLFMAPVKITEGSKESVIGTVLLVQDITEEKVLARSKDEFFSIASHELRTPLTAIKGNASMMIDYYKELLDKDDSFREMVFDIHSSSSRLIEIVNDFLDASRIEQGKMTFHFEPVALDKVIESVFYEMRAVLREKNISLTADTNTLDKLPKLWADRDRIMQILYNLIGNAVKFTEHGGVTLSTKQEGDELVMRVTDTGRGVPVENQKLLFRKFQQAGNSLLTRDTTRGTGLGLYISRMLAESMHGKLELEHSEEGKGSTFLLRLPIATEQQLTSVTTSPGDSVDTATGLSKV